MSGLIVVPQVAVAILAPWVGFHSEKRGRRPLLLIGFALEPVRGLLLAATAAYPALVLAQVLSGVTGAIIGVLTVVVVTDLTAGTGRFNLALGVLGALSGIAASISTTVTGYLFQWLGPHLGYVTLAAVTALATAILWMFLAETKPKNTRINAITCSWRKEPARMFHETLNPKCLGRTVFGEQHWLDHAPHRTSAAQ